MELLDKWKPEATSVWMLGWERDVMEWVNTHRTPVLDVICGAASLVGEWGALWIVVVLALYFWGGPETKRLAVYLGLGLALTALLITVPLMYLLPRQRPYLALPDFPLLSLPLTTPSFPSGHAKSAWMAAVVLGACWPRWRWPLALFALLMCYARLYCGMHYPLDVIVGGLIGGAGGGLVLLLLLRRWRRGAGHDAALEPLG